MTEAQGDLLAETSQTETTSTSGATKQWYSDEYKDVVARTGWKDPNDAIKGYRELEKGFSSRIKLPSPESSAEEIRAFYQKTGCPENPEGYEITISEDMQNLRDESTENAIKQIAYENGINKQAFESIVKAYYDKLNADMIASREIGEKALREEFPDEKAYNEVVNIANRFFDSCSSEFCQLVKDSGLANNPTFIKEFFNKGKQTMSDTLVKGTQEESKEEEYVPRYKENPEMYAYGEDEESQKARAYFEARGFKY